MSPTTQTHEVKLIDLKVALIMLHTMLTMHLHHITIVPEESKFFRHFNLSCCLLLCSIGLLL